MSTITLPAVVMARAPKNSITMRAVRRAAVKKMTFMNTVRMPRA
jgi:hypothetical protein